MDSKTLRQILTLICVFLGVLFLARQAPAQSLKPEKLITTTWRNSEGGRIRISLQPTWQNGRREGLIEVMLKPNWKTYWQNPGSSGMAPTFRFDQNIRYRILYPVPQLFEDGSDWSIGYKDSVSLPFVVEKNDEEMKLTGHLTIGLCRNICIPVDVDFDFSDAKGKLLAPISLLSLAKDKLPEKQPPDSSIRTTIDGDNLVFIITHPEKSNITALYVDGGKTEISPMKIIDKTENKTVFKGKIVAAKEMTPLKINYIVEAKPVSFSGFVTCVTSH
ncbi:protein-disulfide reductase DsbD domain-containing protein [uncultured Bartonella sp.]|uniref:protein-disulfide reductase DsbD domain-containing protein n=1 Tax=uncultured Bartonella sp. TaxID=104108 RepID=UPI002616C3E7|nr:protein-disulfide reductase DsbD domain-containing protein [uncultured Bartonella sp.]